LDSNDLRRGFLLIVDEPARLELVFADLARLEPLWRIGAADPILQPVSFQQGEIYFEGLTDLSLFSSGATSIHASTLSLKRETTPHAVLTGPNGGGKSSFLRAVLQAALLAHTYGFAPASVARLPRLHWIASGIQLRDTPGIYSMFETEVKFAAMILRHTGGNGGPGLVLFDELFHSTNPPDGIRTAELFLKSLWNGADNIYSVVSTHVFSLIEGGEHPNIQPICCPATVDETTGEIQYSYIAQQGVCKVSSVEKVWKRFGLGSAAAMPVRSKPLSKGELDR
jgi:hypothetical protein